MSDCLVSCLICVVEGHVAVTENGFLYLLDVKDYPNVFNELLSLNVVRDLLT